ncbi:MAG: S8 family serine peptidase [Opitutaceae bacterium]|nr:S8 family serine peptidase [Opitutaceae bacterium]
MFARWKRILAPTVIAALSIILFVHFDSEEPVPDENCSVAEAPNQSEKKSAADNVGPPTVGARQPTTNETAPWDIEGKILSNSIGTYGIDAPNAGNPLSYVDINARAGWDIRASAENTVIAVIDSGAKTDHPDLVANFWINQDDPIDGIDNDNNGYVDDHHGINAIDGSGDPSDANGHGNTELATSKETEPLPNQTDDYRALWYRIRLDRDANVIINADTRFKVFKGNALSNLELVDRVSSLRWQDTDIYQLHRFLAE